MKKKALVITFFLLSSPSFSKVKKIIHYYQRNKDIWGTYTLVSKQVKKEKKNSQWPSFSIQDLVLSKKEMHFISPFRKNGRTLIKVEKTSYVKRDGKYILQNKEILRGKDIPSQAYCQRKKKFFKCTFTFTE